MTELSFEQLRALAQDFAKECPIEDSFSSIPKSIMNTPSMCITAIAELESWRYNMWKKGFGTYAEIEQGLAEGRYTLGVYPEIMENEKKVES